jgi:hypothetical protein
LRDAILERGSLDRFHDRNADAAGFLETVDLPDVGMVQGPSVLALSKRGAGPSRGRAVRPVVPGCRVSL